MPGRTRRKALFLDTETAYGQDPSASGAGYEWVPAEKLPELQDLKNPLERTTHTGRNWGVRPEEGPDGWSLTGVEFPLHGLASAAGDGVNASTIADDYEDQILTHIYGVQETTAGAAVTTVTDATTLVVAGDPHDLHDVFPLFESGVPARTRTQWNAITADAAGTYTLAPGFSDFGTAPPTTAAIVYGFKRYLFDDNGGLTLAFVYRDDEQDYTLLGGRCTSAQIRIPADGGRVMLVTSWRGDSKVAETKGSLPTPGVAPALPAIRSVRSPVFFNGTRYDTSEVMIDLGIGATQIKSTYGAEGRADDEHVSQKPMVTIKPRFADAINELKRNVTTGRLLVQIGGGVLTNGAINGHAIHADEATANVVERVDDSGVSRQEVKFEIHDPGNVSSAATRIFQHLRV